MEGLFLFLLLLYFIPAFIALCRGKVNTLAIFVATLLLGWTFIGWVICFVWACTTSKEDRIQKERIHSKCVLKEHKCLYPLSEGDMKLMEDIEKYKNLKRYGE
jgi:hypothetical protein